MLLLRAFGKLNKTSKAKLRYNVLHIWFNNKRFPLCYIFQIFHPRLQFLTLHSNDFTNLQGILELFNWTYSWVPIAPVDPKMEMGIGPSNILKSVGSGIAVPGQAGGGECAEQRTRLFILVSNLFSSFERYLKYKTRINLNLAINQLISRLSN